MGKKILKYALISFMLAAIVITVIFIFKSKSTKNEYKTTVSYDNNGNNNKSTYSEPRKEETLIEYAEDNYLPIIISSFGAFVLLLSFYAYLSKKKEW